MKPDANEELGELLSAYLDNEITAEERARVEQILATDREAKALHDALRRISERLRGAPRETAPPFVIDAVNTRLEREALLAAADRNVVLARHRRPPWRSTLAVAAMLAIAIGGGLYVSLQLAEQGPAAGTLAQREVAPGGSQPMETGVVRDVRGARQNDRSARHSKSPEASGGFGGAGFGGGAESVETFGQGIESTAAKTALADADGAVEADDAYAARDSAADDRTLDQVTERLFADMSIGAKKESSVGYPPLAQPTSNVDTSAEAPYAYAETSLRDRELRAALPAPDEGMAVGSVKTTVERTAALGPTFEQSLRAGAEWPTLADQSFADEPLRLRVQFRTARGERGYRERVDRLLVERGVPAASEVFGGGPAESLDALAKRPSLVTRAARAAVPPANQELYLPGIAGVNFDAQPPENEQVLVRVPPEWLIDLLDEAAARDAANISLSVGGLAADGPDAARALAERLISASPRPEDGQAPSPIGLAGWIERFRSVVRIPGGQTEPSEHLSSTKEAEISMGRRSTRVDQAERAAAETPSPAEASSDGSALQRSGRSNEEYSEESQCPLITLVVDMSAENDSGLGADDDD